MFTRTFVLFSSIHNTSFRKNTTKPTPRQAPICHLSRVTPWGGVVVPPQGAEPKTRFSELFGAFCGAETDHALDADTPGPLGTPPQQNSPFCCVGRNTTQQNGTLNFVGAAGAPDRRGPAARPPFAPPRPCRAGRGSVRRGGPSPPRPPGGLALGPLGGCPPLRAPAGAGLAAAPLGYKVSPWLPTNEAGALRSWDAAARPLRASRWWALRPPIGGRVRTRAALGHKGKLSLKKPESGLYQRFQEFP